MPPRPPSPPGQPLISLCMIARDEERWLAMSLGSVRPWVDEIVLVDTGSTDRSREIAAGFGARVLDHPWEHDFAKHRNQALEAARGRWILLLDADEELDQATAPHLRPVVESPQVEGFDALLVEIVHLAADGGHGSQVTLRILRNFQGIHFEGRIHERLAGGNGRALRSPIRLIHHGFAQAPEVLAAKAARNLALVREWVEQEPDNPLAWAYLAQTQMGSPATAAAALEAGLKARELTLAQGASPSLLPRVYHPILMALTALDDRPALIRMARECLDLLPHYPDPLYSLTWAHLRDGALDEVCRAARRWVALQDHWRANPLEYPYGENLSLYLATKVLARWALAAARLGREQEAREALARLRGEQDGERAASEVLDQLTGEGLGGLAHALGLAREQGGR